MTIVITGFSDSSKVPGGFGEVRFAQSQVRFGAAPLKILCVGLKRDGTGSLAVDSQVARILSKEDADTYAGAGGELNRMLCAAIDETVGLSGFELYAAAPTGFGGAASTLTITVTGTASAAGTIDIWIGADFKQVAVANGAANTAVAAAIDAAILTMERGRVTPGTVSNVTTLTNRTSGIRGNQLICYVDFSLAPGVTLALGGAGANVTQATPILGRYFGGGTGTEAYTTLLAALYPTFHKFVAWAANDATSLAAIELQVDAKAGPLEGHKEHNVVSNSGAFAAATSIAQTTLNNARFSLKWLEISETPPSEISAAVACLRAALEQTTPNKAYDGYAYRTIKAQRFPSDWVTQYTEKQAALDVGVSPLESRADAKVYEVRSIGTRCLNGVTPDYRCLDTSESFVADYCNERLLSVWDTEYKVANPHVAPDPTAEEPELEAGVGSPSSWSARANAEMLQMQKELIVIQAALHPVESEYNYVANRIMSVNPVVPLPHQHAIGVLSKQMNVAQV